jgi:hypothetical protein
MKTTNQVIQDSGIPSRVVRAVVRRIGRESIEDVNKGEIDGGFSGFITYSDTEGFWRKYREEITEMLDRMADDMGQGVVEMVQGFNCLGSEFTTNEIARAIYGIYRNNATIARIYNALAWFAAEEVCRAFED